MISTMPSPKKLELGLKGLLRNKDVQVRPVKLGTISSIDFGYVSDHYHIDRSFFGSYHVLESYTHENCRVLSQRLGFEFRRPLAYALKERGIKVARIYGDCDETEHDLKEDPSLEEACEGYYEVHMHPVKPRVKQLIHDAAIFNSNNRTLPRLLSSLEQGVVGDPTRDVKIGVPTYLKKGNIDLDTTSFDLCGGYGNINVRFYVDVQRLLQFRHVYHDPGSVWGRKSDNPEACLTFIVIGGIPISSIKNFVIWIDKPPEIIALAKKWGLE